MKWKTAVVVSAAAGSFLTTVVANGSSAAAAPSCVEADVAVPTAHADWTVHGTLCQPAGEQPDAVLVLVPGTTYTGSYWDVPIEPETFSFRTAMNRAGYATFTMDRIGSGRSTIPPSTSVTAQRQAGSVHDVVQALRNGDIGASPFGKVVLGGHSLGSAVATYEAAIYQDVDGVLLTGFSHHLNLVNLGVLFTPGVGTQPAPLDPALEDRGYDLGYVTTLPTGRSLLYGPDDVPANVRAWDEATKDATSLTEIATALPTAVPLPALPVVSPATDIPSSQSITVDVLLVNGQKDKLMCHPLIPNCASSESLRSTEQPFFPNAASFDAALVAGSGHDINLSVHSPDYHQIVLDWLDRTVRA